MMTMPARAFSAPRCISSSFRSRSRSPRASTKSESDHSGALAWRASPGTASARLGGLALVFGEKRQQRALDRRLTRWCGDLRAEQIGHVKDVDDALAEGRHMRRGDVEVELGDRRGQLVQQTGTIEPGDLDHRVAV